MGEEKKKVKIKIKKEEEGAAATEGEKEIFQLISRISKLLDKIESFKGVELEFDEIILEGVSPPYEFFFKVLKSAITAPPKEVKAPPKLEAFKFEKPIKTYTGKFNEVKIGATKEEGGTRAFTITVGGNKTYPFYAFEEELAHRPVIAHAVFDEDPHLPKALREYYDDVKDDPVKWAKKVVEKYNAKMIWLDLNSTDPHGTNRSAEEAAETVKAVLEAVKVPICVCTRTGSMKKDLEVLRKCAEVAAGENVILYSGSFVLPAMFGMGVSLADEIIDYYRTAVEYGHIAVNYGAMNLPGIAVLNMEATKRGAKKEKVLQDVGTMALGYGTETMVTGMDAIYAKALAGDENYQPPIVFSPANAWMSREAYAEEEEWGDAKQRGRCFEIGLAMAGLMSGAHILVMLDQFAIEVVENFLDRIYTPKIETVEDLLRHMQKSDCKACGYETCRGLAEAIMKGEESIDKCEMLLEGGKRTLKRLLNPPEEPIAEAEEVYNWIKEIP